MSILKSLASTVGKKFLMALSGLALVLFLCIHLLGNLTLYDKTGLAFNGYAAKLKSLGPGFYVGEVLLLGLIAFHIIVALWTKQQHLAARPIGYAVKKTKGGPSKSNLASLNMIFSGVLLAVFIFIHVKSFRFGPAEAEGYKVAITTTHGSETVRDLYRLVAEKFADPLYSGFYIFSMLLLAAHLRHGFWSAFQSLGAIRPSLEKPILCLGILVALVLGAGFLALPVYFLVGGGR